MTLQPRLVGYTHTHNGARQKASIQSKKTSVGERGNKWYGPALRKVPLEGRELESDISSLRPTGHTVSHPSVYIYIYSTHARNIRNSLHAFPRLYWIRVARARRLPCTPGHLRETAEIHVCARVHEGWKGQDAREQSDRWERWPRRDNLLRDVWPRWTHVSFFFLLHFFFFFFFLARCCCCNGFFGLRRRVRVLYVYVVRFERSSTWRVRV